MNKQYYSYEISGKKFKVFNELLSPTDVIYLHTYICVETFLNLNMSLNIAQTLLCLFLLFPKFSS